MDFFRDLFKTDFMPHGHCYFWKADVLWSNVIGDGIIALAYFTIPFMLFYFARRRKDMKNLYAVLILFALFIFGCGMTHVLSIISVWTPVYRLDGLMKLLTGAISIYTAYTLVKLVPAALSLPSRVQMTSANDQLQEANAQLEQKTRELKGQNEFLSKLAFATYHDLREPVRTMSMNSQVLMQKYGGRMEEEEKAIVQRVIDEGKRMYNSVDSILKFTFLESEQYVSEKVNLEVVIAIVEKNLRKQIEDSLATINYNDLPQVIGNERLLIILFENIISNSLAFHSDQPPIINISAREEADQYVISVADNGTGFDPKHKERVFEIFQRLGNSPTYRGAGLGLALCRRITQILHGSITADSMEGLGTDMIIKLPKAAKR